MTFNSDIAAVGVDIGGTKILAGKIAQREIVKRKKVSVPVQGTMDEVLQALYESIDGVFDESIGGIGVGVPSVVDVENGIVYDVQNIPSWKIVFLKDILEKRYDVPVFLNNDANCFGVGEKYFGKGQDYKDVVALIIGTGIAAGIMINGTLYNGRNCGAGEFGMVPYLDHHYEFYSSGQFFENVHGVNGMTAFQKAEEGDIEALNMFGELGRHIGNAINMILYAYDPEIIILGGSVSKAFPFFKEDMWNIIRQLVYRSVVENIKIEVSDIPDMAVWGAAALYYESLTSASSEIK